MSQLFLNYTHFSQEDLIGELNLTNRSFNALTRAGIRTVGEVAQLVESGGLQTIPALGEKSISEIEDRIAQIKFNDSEAESLAKTNAILALKQRVSSPKTTSRIRQAPNYPQSWKRMYLRNRE